MNECLLFLTEPFNVAEAPPAVPVRGDVDPAAAAMAQDYLVLIPEPAHYSKPDSTEYSKPDAPTVYSKPGGAPSDCWLPTPEPSTDGECHQSNLSLCAKAPNYQPSSNEGRYTGEFSSLCFKHA